MSHAEKDMSDAAKDALQALNNGVPGLFEASDDVQYFVAEILGHLYQKGLNTGQIDVLTSDNFNNNLGKPLSERHYR